MCYTGSQCRLTPCLCVTLGYSAEKTIEHKDGSQLHMKMQYTALPVIDLEAAEVEKRKKVTEGGCCLGQKGFLFITQPFCQHCSDPRVLRP